MKNTFIRIMCLALAVLMLIPFAVSCSKETTGDNTGENVDNTIDYQAILGFGPEDNQDYKFRMLVTDTDAYEHKATELNSNFVNDAVFKRNIAVQDFFKIQLEVKEVPGAYVNRAEYLEALQTPILVGDHEHDMVTGLVGVVAHTLGNAYLLPVNQLDYIDLSKEWWVAGQYDNLQVNGNIYSLYGDMNLSLYADIHAFMFNVNLLDTNGLKSPYALVKDNEWTYDKMVEYSAVVGAGDGDDVVELAEDTFGIIGNTNADRALITGFDLNILGRNQSTNELEFPEALDQTFTEAYAKISNSFKVNTYNSFEKDSDNIFDESLKAMAEDRCLFLPAYLNWMTDPIITAMVSDFGIVPYPKLTTEQTSYRSQIATGATATLFPKTLDEKAATLSAKVATYMSYVGKEMVATPYYNNYLKERLARSPEMQEMLDLIRSTAVMTLSTAYATMFSKNILSLYEVSAYNDFGEGIADEYASRKFAYKQDLKTIKKQFATSK